MVCLRLSIEWQKIWVEPSDANIKMNETKIFLSHFNRHQSSANVSFVPFNSTHNDIFVLCRCHFARSFFSFFFLLVRFFSVLSSCSRCSLLVHRLTNANAKAHSIAIVYELRRMPNARWCLHECCVIFFGSCLRRCRAIAARLVNLFLFFGFF